MNPHDLEFAAITALRWKQDMDNYWLRMPNPFVRFPLRHRSTGRVMRRYRGYWWANMDMPTINMIKSSA